jgi:PadR family transcriptional regulator, regulatory protein PadR
MVEEVRISRQMLKVLKMMVEKPREGRSGAEISKGTAVSSGTLYPLLQRLEQAGWVTSEWEEIRPSEVGRPRRRFYTLTALGQTRAIAALTELQTAPGVLACT